MKTFIWTLILSLIIFSCTNEKRKFSLEADITNIADSTLFYLKTASNTTLDSAYLINNHLSLKGDLKSQKPEELTLFTTEPEFIYTMLLVENEQIQFSADKMDFPWNVDVSGSVHQDKAEKFNEIMYQRQQLKANLTPIYGANKELLSEKIDRMSDSLDNVTIGLIKENINSYAALSRMKYYRTKFSNHELSNLYNQLDKELKEIAPGKAMKLQSDFLNPTIGHPYYDYKAINQNGDTVSLSSTKNKYILLHFSSSACYGSQLSLPELKKLHKNNLDDLEIISISTDTSREQWQNHVKRDSIPWTYLWDGKGNYNDAYVKYWLNGTPNYVLVSPNKVILEKWMGYGHGLIEEKLKKHFDIK